MFTQTLSRRMLRTPIAGAAMLGLMLGVAPAAQATPPSSGASVAATPAESSSQVVMTAQQYDAYVAGSSRERAQLLAQNPGINSSSRALAANDSVYERIATVPDKDKVSIPLRQGTAASGGFGYNHYATSHNLTATKPVTTALMGPTVTQSGARREYESVVFNPKTMKKSAVIHVVAQAATSTDDRKWKTPDGLYIGVITAYCVGVNVCPSIVNTV